jgi:hypothetical protein
MRGTSTSEMTWRNGSAVLSTTRAIGSGRRARATARISVTCRWLTVPGGTDVSRR